MNTEIINDDEQPIRVINDPRLGKEVIFLDESRRRGYQVVGELITIERYQNGDELWEAVYRGFTCGASSKEFQLIEEIQPA